LHALIIKVYKVDAGENIGGGGEEDLKIAI
jgi:hypothetical protein